MHQCIHEHCRQQSGLGEGNMGKNKSQGSRNKLKQVVVLVVEEEQHDIDQNGLKNMLNQHVTCAIARDTWVDSDWPLNLDEIAYFDLALTKL